jgi:glutathione S-transferase
LASDSNKKNTIMPDFTLYYWPIPFRGQFVRAVLAQAQATWHEASLDDTARLRLEET